MPRTSVLECPGCPPIRALTTDGLGLIKVVEARGKAGIPKVVETWGSPDASRHVILASMADRERDPLVAIARKNNTFELLNPLNGDVLAMEKVNEALPAGDNADDDPLAALHLFRTRSESRSNTLLMCTERGKACLRSISISSASKKSMSAHSVNTWDVCNSGKVQCSSVDGPEKHALFAGKGIEVNLWDLEKCNKIWTAKSPPCNSIGIFTPTWFTATTFLCKDDHRKIAAGTDNHQVRLYDISAQRRPVISVEFRESPIKAIAEDFDGYTIYLGTGKGDLASIDMRTGKLLGCFIGKCSGSIRSIVKHPELPVIASCGLDRYLRFWDTKTRQLLSAVFLKQILTNVVIDSKFSDEETAGNTPDKPSDSALTNQSEVDSGEEPEEGKPSKRRIKMAKLLKNMNKAEPDIGTGTAGADENDLRSALHEKKQRKPKHKKREKQAHEDDHA